ncbi:hypothetical protein PLESTM_000590400 [Pleodorina starrii]|nr:hypothetical protein PLESTM_000590400 [Pleodorina starrii]
MYTRLTSPHFKSCQVVGHSPPSHSSMDPRHTHTLHPHHHYHHHHPRHNCCSRGSLHPTSGQPQESRFLSHPTRTEPGAENQSRMEDFLCLSSFNAVYVGTM